MTNAKKVKIKLKNYSPLRYPGGKGKLYPFVAAVIKNTNIQHPVYIEPFAGGAGVALSLLFNGDVDEIVINDYDKAIYSMWRAILTQTDAFISLIRNTPVTVEEWYRQKEIYTTQNKKYSLALGFATFFLNRTNRSGILKGGPIGGYNQAGKYLIDARYNKDDLVERVKEIANFRTKIHLYNHDVRSFVRTYLPRYADRAFVYFDPPYFKKGKYLYKNFFVDHDHQEIHDMIEALDCPWLVTYDNSPEIQAIYRNHQTWLFDLIYGVANNGVNSEMLYISNERLLPSPEEREKLIKNLRQAE